jgi:tetratricopeptide (TPR) repeat protein
MGSLHTRARRYAAAKEELRRALEIDPDLPQAYVRLAEVHQALGETDAAIGQYDRALARQGKSAVLHGIVGSLHHNNNNPAAARKHYEQALAIDPRLASVANNLAWLQATEGGNLDVALSLAQRAKAQLPDSPTTSDTLAWILYKKGLYSAAIPLMQECVVKVPSSPTYRYHLGMALLASGRKQEGKTQLEAALRMKLTAGDDQAARAALDGISK